MSAPSVVLPCVLGLAVALAGCTSLVPYRTGDLKDDKSCADVYRRHDANPGLEADWDHGCWKRSVEEHERYDLLTIEFDDQGWVQGSEALDSPADDYLAKFFLKLEEIHQRERRKKQGLSIFVFTHGWKHNAKPHDGDVRSFRAVLRDLATMEDFLATKGTRPMRVVGIYVGWRGASLDVPLLRELTFWERKNTAHAVAQGSVREMFKRLDYFRDRSRGDDGADDKDIRMLTVGHSFGGLITFESMSSEFVRNTVRFKQTDRHMSRVGDLVVLVNPAFEGARYESLRAAARRDLKYDRDQLPVSLVITSRADWATKYAFPFARWFSTLLEKQEGVQGDAIVKTVGHNERYITHELAACAPEDAGCRKACPVPRAQRETQIGSLTASMLEAEFAFMKHIEETGFPRNVYLCGSMSLNATEQWTPANNPYWVVRTTEDIIDDHSDLFNPRLVAFVRQMYLGFIYARHIAKRK